MHFSLSQATLLREHGDTSCQHELIPLRGTSPPSFTGAQASDLHGGKRQPVKTSKHAAVHLRHHRWRHILSQPENTGLFPGARGRTLTSSLLHLSTFPSQHLPLPSLSFYENRKHSILLILPSFFPSPKLFLTPFLTPCSLSHSRQAWLLCPHDITNIRL